MLEIPESAEWYVRGAIDRSISHAQQQIEDTKKALTENPDIPATIRQSLENIIAYHQQWLDEAIVEFKKLPKEILPLRVREY